MPAGIAGRTMNTGTRKTGMPMICALVRCPLMIRQPVMIMDMGLRNADLMPPREAVPGSVGIAFRPRGRGSGP